MIIETVVLPSFFASALINGDLSALTDSDERLLNEIHRWLSERGLRIVDVVENSTNEFAHLFTPFYFAGEVVTYVAHKEVES